MLIAILVVLVGIVAVAIGRGGELSEEQPDYAPLELGPVSATDVVLLRPPTALWGYSMQATDDALEQIAGAIRDRDVRIVALEQRIADLTSGDQYATATSTARHARRLSPPPSSGVPPEVRPAVPSLPGPPMIIEPVPEPPATEQPAAEQSELATPETEQLLPPDSSVATQPSPVLDTGPIEVAHEDAAPTKSEAAESEALESEAAESRLVKSGPDTEPIRHKDAEPTDDDDD